LRGTDMVKCGDVDLTAAIDKRCDKPGTAVKRKKRQAKSMKPESSAASVRATITFPPEVYATLEVIAKEKKVSLAWVVRDAAEKYIADKWPLLKGQG
jgi:hypothetical protein